MEEKKVFRFRTNADVNELQGVLDFVNECMQNTDCPPKTMMHINVAVEEIFINIANYAYSDKMGEVFIEVEIANETKTIIITLLIVELNLIRLQSLNQM